MRYRVMVDATFEARSNQDALRLIGEKLVASAEENEPWPVDGHLTELTPLNYWIQVGPVEE